MTTPARVLLAGWLMVVPVLVHSSQHGQPASLAWQAVGGGPMGGNATRLIESTSGVLLARVNDVLYRSIDDGRSWRRCRDLPPRSAPQSPSWIWNRIADSERPDPLREYPPNALHVTDERCETFGTVQIPGWTGNTYEDLTFVDTSQQKVAVMAGRVLRSANHGATWQQAFSFRDGPRTCAAVRFRDLLVVAGSTLYQSMDEGATWSLVPEDPEAARAGSVVPGRSPKLGCPFIQANALYVVGPEGVWRSYPLDTQEWTRVHPGRPDLVAAAENRVWMQMPAPQGKVLLRSEDEGATWTTIPFTLARDNQVHALLDARHGTLIAGTSAGIFRSTDKGQSWTLTGVPPERLTVAASRRMTYASDRSGLWVTRDAGASWQKAQATIAGKPWTPNDQLSRVFDVAGQTAAVINNELFRVTGDGVSFVRTGLEHHVGSLVHARGTYYAATDDGVFRSRDFATWTECSLGLNADFTPGPLLVIGQGDLLRAAATRSTDGCRSWWPFETDRTAGRPEFMFTRSREVIGLGDGIVRLDVDTRVWTDIKDSTEIDVTSAAADARGRYWMGTAHGVYVLMPGGHGWEVFPMGLQHEQIEALVVDGRGYLIAAVRGRGLYRAALP